MKIRNLTNSPYSLRDADGSEVILPANGSVTIDPHPTFAGLYRGVGYFETVEDDGELAQPKKRGRPRKGK